MKVIVTIEAQFEVEVDTLNAEHAVRTVEGSWDSIFRHQAKWRDGTAPLMQHGKVVSVEAEKARA